MADPHESHQRLPRFRSNAEDEAFFAAVNRALAVAELPALTAAADPAALPLIYIVGAPRSGTTLMSQLLSRSLPVGYIDNVVARFWQRPSVGIRLSQVLLGADRRQAVTFDSRHGVTSGLAGPHEFGFFWRQWLQLDSSPTHHLDEAAQAALDVEGLRRALRTEILAPWSLPTVFKNVICGFHASWLSQVHRPSLFIHVERRLDATCASILKARIDRYGSYSAWWSLKPAAYPAIAAIDDPCLQVVRQVDHCRREFRSELERSGVVALTVDYDDLCRNPSEVLLRVCGAVTDLGCELRPLDDVPAGFQPSAGPVLPAPIDTALRAALSH